MQAAFPFEQHGITSGAAWRHIPRGYACHFWGVASAAVRGRALPSCPQPTPRGWGSRSASQMSVPAWVSLPGTKTSRAVIFSPSAYGNGFLPAPSSWQKTEPKQGPARAGSTSGPRTPLLGGSCCGTAYF